MLRTTNNTLIKKYQEKMRKQGRCDQCVSPWNDGICECNKKQSKEAKDFQELIIAYANYLDNDAI